ncbi:hypothetical protein NDR87_02720 [Nocardia sp. CDC159]|uniref:Uncharacterized protein n=1 Tax=Nocardia pulmonis TaxID=2951408 RepID=A0A9X2IV49_9NOCA|nr:MULTISPECIES: hypothetical protein [Nocardia]MCM6772074.1 hypothetical protein [Nocardia pulmonis]MCM6785268.1 hypothetical protein [Nocardia sp. CDC159]
MKRIMNIPGARSVTLVDGSSGLSVAAAGRHAMVDQHEDAASTTDVVRAVLSCPALTTGRTGDDVTEIIIGGTYAFHLLRLVAGDFDGRLFVHVLFDGDSGNLAMARYQLQVILDEFAEDGRGH